MAKKKSKNKELKLLTDKQEKELQEMVNGMLDIAANVVNEYEDLDLEDLEILSGSITQIHEDSPFLNEIFKGNSWKRVLTNMNNIPKKTKDDASE
tara:strand:- start:54 stop:338 length:285 start_codon:yes stop_codon:yes gene_type:complete